MVRVGEQFETEAFFRAELLVRIDAIQAQSQNHSIALGKFVLVHLKLVGFAGSTRSLIFGVEIKDDPFAAIIPEADLTILGGQGEIGSHGSLSGFRRARQHARNYEYGDNDHCDQ